LSEDLTVRVKRFIEEVSRDWGVRPPNVVIRRVLEYMDADAYYDETTKTMVLDPRGVTLRIVLHEFAHHLQFEYGLVNRDILRREIGKAHCARNYERWAKTFEKSFDRFYERLWGEIVGV
jgi:hypothetical protein